ncbi:MAG: bifunctional metallophosphatase/5'-nucleotidase [Acidobacteria bacterium]|nr:bifunctional metallophosphatase/5'-nucleotidase [Acidobacteriota bacterium]
MMRKPRIRAIPFIAAVLLLIGLILAAGDRLSAMFAPAPSDPVRRITLFYTSDEEGYLEPTRDRVRSYGGSAQVMAALRQRGYLPGGEQSLLLSGGDMWTGPAISTWFEGESTVAVMNAMGYQAAAIGNHEFDFGQERLRANRKAARFPFLSANLTVKDTGERPDYALPYILREVNGVKVAVIGLTTRQTPGIVVPDNIAGLEVTDYAEALRRTVPRAAAEGAELPVVIAHVCPTDLHTLVPVAAELSIPLMLGGHCHSVVENVEQKGVRIIGPGAHWQSFAQVEIAFDKAARKVVHTRADLVRVEHPLKGTPLPSDPAIAAIVAGWSKKAEAALGEVIGYTRAGIPRGQPLYDLLLHSWLWAYPEADIAISNFGGFREAIAPGEITRADILTTWPFNNDIVSVDLTGAQLVENLRRCGGAAAGLTYRRSGEEVEATLDSGRPLDPAATYRVLVNSYMYAGGDHYLFKTQNPNGTSLGVPMQDPVIRWIQAQKTSPQHPLETLLQDKALSPRR